MVLGEVNERVPRTLGDAWVAADRLDKVLRTSRDPLYVPARPPTELELRIGALVAGEVPDRAVLQLGVGSVFRAIGESLAGGRDLSIHAGVIGNWVVGLSASGAVTNSSKPVD